MRSSEGIYAEIIKDSRGASGRIGRGAALMEIQELGIVRPTVNALARKRKVVPPKGGIHVLPARRTR